MKSSYLLKTLLAVAILGTSYLPNAYAAFSFGELNGYGDVTMNASDVGQSFTTNWLCSANTTCGTGTTITPQTLSATGTFTLESYSSNQLKFSATITNTTSKSFQAALTAVGLYAPSFSPGTISTSPGSVFQSINSKSIPSFNNNTNQPTNVCISPGSNCSGSSIYDGLGDGYPGLDSSTDTFSFTLSNSGTIGSSVTLSDFAVKFQAVNSYEFGDGITPSPTPEPASFWLLGSALLFMIGVHLRKGMPKKA
ncbi:MAG: cistern family PEP-CTERM protein [Leptospirillum sp.]|jgi:hypothetical protein